MKVELSAVFKPEKPWGMPIHLQVEPTTKCNLRCALCPVTVGLDRPDQHMKLETFKKIIDETGEFVFLLLMWDWGEPFLNPDIYEMIAYAKKRGIKVISSTNGHIFSQPGNAERLVTSGIDSIIFAIDGIEQETYKKYRKGGNLKTVLSGIKKVVAAKKALKLKTPLINFRFIAMRHNEHEIPFLTEFARKLGVDVLTIKTINPTCNNAGDKIVYDDPEYIPENKRYQRFTYLKNFTRIRLNSNPCKQLWNNPVFHSNGNVSPCTFDPYEKMVLGSVMQQLFSDIWQNNEYRSLRNKFKNNYQRISICAQCTNAFKGGKMSRDTVPFVHYF